MKIWHWIRHEGEKLYSIGLLDDGRLYNPNNYPADVVIAAIEGAKERQRERRHRAALQGAETRQRRREQLIYSIVGQLRLGHRYGPRQRCKVCGRHLDDTQSIERGIGLECWQTVLKRIQQSRETIAPSADTTDYDTMTIYTTTNI